jgi:hypothetical protein
MSPARLGREGVAGRRRRVNPAVTSFVYAPPTISPAHLCRGFGLVLSEWRVMLRFVLVFTVSLIAASLLLHGNLLDGSHPCIAVADTSLEVSDLPWHADLHVAFTDDPAAATVRVGLSDGPEGADFAVVDDADDSEPTACEVNPRTRFVTVWPNPAVGAPIIYLAGDGPADFRIFVRSNRFSVRDAAALVVSAGGGHISAQSAAL